VFGWGYSGAGPHLLYQALVHTMDGSVAPATDGRFIGEPSSFYGWLTARQHTPDVNDVVDEALAVAERLSGRRIAGLGVHARAGSVGRRHL